MKGGAGVGSEVSSCSLPPVATHVAAIDELRRFRAPPVSNSLPLSDSQQVVLVTYADGDPFIRTQERLIAAAHATGFDSIRSWNKTRVLDTVWGAMPALEPSLLSPSAVFKVVVQSV